MKPKLHNNMLLPFSGSSSWYDEYKRLCDNVPVVLTEVLTKHTHQVLHVSFSNNGKMFATSSKDGFIIVWRASFPATVKYEYVSSSLLNAEKA